MKINRVVPYIALIGAGLALGLVLAQYLSGGMVLAFLQKVPGCF